MRVSWKLVCNSGRLSASRMDVGIWVRGKITSAMGVGFSIGQMVRILKEIGGMTVRMGKVG